MAALGGLDCLDVFIITIMEVTIHADWVIYVITILATLYIVDLTLRIVKWFTERRLKGLKEKHNSNVGKWVEVIFDQDPRKIQKGLIVSVDEHGVETIRLPSGKEHKLTQPNLQYRHLS